MTIMECLTSRPEAADQVLVAARERRRSADAAEAELLQLAVDWVVMHPAESIHEPATHTLRGFGETDLPIAGPGAPTVAEFAVAEFAATIGLSTEAGKRYLGEAVELRYRLPRLWKRVTRGDLPVWKARLVARETIRLSIDAAAFLDQHAAPIAHKIKPAQLDRVVAEAIGRFMPDELERLAAASWDKRHVTLHDQMVSFTGTMHLDAELDIADALDLAAAITAGAERRAALGSAESLDVRRSQAMGDLARGEGDLDLTQATSPAVDSDDALGARSGEIRGRQVVLHVHLAQAAIAGDDPVARLERGDALVTAEQVRSWCGRHDSRIIVKPVLDLAACTWADSDNVPDRIADQVATRDRTCVFPWCTRPARRCQTDLPDDHACDYDHIHPRSSGGRTCSCNIAPLCRRHHRLKTHSPWSYLVLDPGTYLWTTPHGYQFLRDDTGTLDVSADRPHARPPDT
jgi:hypothetical protein